jgi:Ca-activated chloride channel homolog
MSEAGEHMNAQHSDFARRLLRKTPAMASAVALAALTALVHSCASYTPYSARRPSAAESPAAEAPSEALEFGDEDIDGELLRPDGAPTLPSAEDFADLRVVGGEKPAESVFQHYGTNPTVDTAEDRFSTFSVDVDTASYSIARAMLLQGSLPDPAAVRVEEFVNSFSYRYPPPTKQPFSVVAEAFPSPNRKGYHVLLLGLRGKVIEAKARPPANLVFVVDVSGSMEMGGRLEMVKGALGVLVDQLREDDSVAIVTYGDVARTVLESASGAEKARIKAALARLRPEGSTNAQAGILLGYEIADKARRPRSLNRVILCSDGVANNGVTDADGIFATVGTRATQGIALSTIGFGMGNYNDVLMERLAVKGQGRYDYVDRPAEAKKIFVENLNGTLVTIASDVKIQLELDPESVQRYRLIGFENRRLTRRDFHDDKVDAGEIGAGHEVTALYEVKLKPGADRIGWLRVRSKVPGEAASRLIVEELGARLVRPSIAGASPLSRLALVASAFAEKLRGSYWARNLSWQDLRSLYQALPTELRRREDVAELGVLLDRARDLDRRGDRFEGEQPVATMDFDHLPVVKR